MSLLLDALKKAANDKKKSVDDSTDESLAQDNNRADDEDSLELELDEKQIADIDQDDDNDFPQVEDQPIVSHPQHAKASADDHTVTEATTESTDEPQTDSLQDKNNEETDRQTDSDTTYIDQADELQLTDTQTADTGVADKPEKKHTATRQSDSLTTSEFTDDASTNAATPTVSQATDQSSTTEDPNTLNAVNQTDRAHHSTDNEVALSALINKSNQYQRRAQKKRTILLTTLILLLISGSAVFFYLKTEMASQELYIAQKNTSPLLPEATTVNDRSQSTADSQTVTTNTQDNSIHRSEPAQTNNSASHSHSNQQAVSKPRTTKTSSPARNAVTDKAAQTPIHIQQSSREDPIEALVMDAYNAFQRDQYEQAETLYQQVLVQEPRNRDAMLGLAAIALKQQRYEVARQKYQTLLQLNPQDSLAIAGLSSVNQNSTQHLAGSGLSESQLKFMLKEQPDAAHLYFALGSLYAAKTQWPQAQSAYFSAWSADSSNADYAFNLAVSLDHINQLQQALQYYQLSLKLMRNSTANFSATQVQQRINSLQEAMQ